MGVLEELDALDEIADVMNFFEKNYPNVDIRITKIGCKLLQIHGSIVGRCLLVNVRPVNFQLDERISFFKCFVNCGKIAERRFHA